MTRKRGSKGQGPDRGSLLPVWRQAQSELQLVIEELYLKQNQASFKNRKVDSSKLLFADKMRRIAGYGDSFSLEAVVSEEEGLSTFKKLLVSSGLSHKVYNTKFGLPLSTERVDSVFLSFDPRAFAVSELRLSRAELAKFSVGAWTSFEYAGTVKFVDGSEQRFASVVPIGTSPRGNE